ncbi:hypothetical protein OE88DRAFT_1730363 [Heliocybe sulcata]|uniref:Uncharacterized protein n=1 Tax=Heliocybe sulcata TaxID=5364 RepID=A0A5C3NT64_9AGAM|nr:hypothetical protein OE88DRAFT_1730363 [Heliocybe sulcata]
MTLHAPASGRRLSLNSNITTRPRLRTISASEPIEPGVPGVVTHDPPTDYPRPNGPHAEADDHHHDHEEDVPKREKRQGHNNVERELKLRESVHRKADMNRPNKQSQGGKDGARGGRIAQPAGKALAV